MNFSFRFLIILLIAVRHSFLHTRYGNSLPFTDDYAGLVPAQWSVAPKVIRTQSPFACATLKRRGCRMSG